MIIVVLVTSAIVFMAMRLLPGDPITTMMGLNPRPETIDRLRAELGLDRPVWEQYLLYLGRFLRGDWGYSMIGISPNKPHGEPVLPLIIRRFEATLYLSIFGFAISSAIGITLGVLSAAKHGTIVDTVIKSVSTVGYSTPIFWVGAILILIFSVQLGWFPSIGRRGILSLVLPGLTLSVWFTGLIAKMTRGSMLDVFSKDFVLTAKAKGLSQSRILFVHILKNAMLVVFTYLSLQLGILLAGAVVTETVFSYPGLGLLMVQSVLLRDYPVVQGCVIFSTTIIVVINFFTDILYSYLDPRVKLEDIMG